MPYVAPSTVVAGQTYSASAHNVIVNDVIDHESRINQYAGVYTNEAARDAAITSPTEGMRVYLTAPTVPTATGATTMIPTGIMTVYNGSAWVCVSEVGARTLAAGTTTSTSWTATLGGSPGVNPSVTLTTGTTALLMMSAELSNSASGNAVAMSVAVSGASTIGATNDYSCYIVTTVSGAAFVAKQAFVGMVTGLTAGTNTFTLNYWSSAGVVTATIGGRSLVVKGIA